MNNKETIKIAVNALEDVKGENIQVIDTHQHSPLFGTIIICSGKSTRQVAALANRVSEDLKEHGIEILGIEGKRSGEWVLVDGGDIVIHIMLPHVREYYDLETLWDREAIHESA